MARIRVSYVKSDVDRHGNVRYYFRRRDLPRKIRLPGLPGSAEFMQVYQNCLNGQHPAAAQLPKKPVNEQKSLQWLCAQYFASAEFKQLENTTRKRRRTIIEGVCCAQASDDNPKLIGTLPFATIPPRAVRRLRDRKAELPEAANGRLKALKAMFRWAVDADYMEVNPAKDVPRIRTASKGFHTWTIKEVRQFEEHHPVGTTPRLAFTLLLYTGQRRSDVVLFGRQHVKDGWLKFTQHKNRNRKPVTLELPILPQLQAIIDATPSGNMTLPCHCLWQTVFGRRLWKPLPRMVRSSWVATLQCSWPAQSRSLYRSRERRERKPAHGNIRLADDAAGCALYKGRKAAQDCRDQHASLAAQNR
jgi:integrase